MYCRKCGESIPDNSQKCPKCGAPTGNLQFDVNVNDQTGDILIRVAALILGIWLCSNVFKPFIDSFKQVFIGLTLLRYGSDFVLNYIIGFFGFVHYLSYMSTGVNFIIFAVLWNRQKMNELFSRIATSVFSVIMVGVVRFVFEVIHYGSYYLYYFKSAVKFELPPLIAFLALFLIAAYILPVIPLSDPKNLKRANTPIQYNSPNTPGSVSSPANNDSVQKNDRAPVRTPETSNSASATPAGNTGIATTVPKPARLTTNRNAFAYLILVFLTCGLYGLIELHTIAKEMNTCCAGDGKSTPGVVKLFLLTFITCGFYAIYFWYALENRIQDNGRRYGLYIQESGASVILWMFLGTVTCFIGTFIGFNILFTNMNKLFAAYNAEQDRLVTDIEGGY